MDVDHVAGLKHAQSGQAGHLCRSGISDRTASRSPRAIASVRLTHVTF